MNVKDIKRILVTFFKNYLSISEHHLWVTLNKHEKLWCRYHLEIQKDRLQSFLNFRRFKNKRQNLKDDSASI